MGRAQSIQIFLPTGEPSGLRIASIPTRTVQVFDVPRPKLAEFLARPEASRVCVYYLFGTDGNDGNPQAYIGQTGNAGERLRQHNADSAKDFWSRALLAVSLTNEWTQTHVSFLEWESISLAKRADRYELKNGNNASRPHTPEPLQADCEEFLGTIRQLLAILGYPVLEVPKRGTTPTVEEVPAEKDTGTPVFFTQRRVKAEGVYSSEGLLVLAGSRGSIHGDISAAHRVSHLSSVSKLISEGVVQKLDDSTLIFRRDHLFSSPSAAGGALLGNSVNGRTVWVDASGKTIKVLDEEAAENSGGMELFSLTPSTGSNSVAPD